FYRLFFDYDSILRLLYDARETTSLYWPDPRTVRQRIMKIDTDGNLRLYSLAEHENGMKWEIQWQAMSHSCKIHEFYGYDIHLLMNRTVDSCKKDCLQDSTCTGSNTVGMMFC
ncbi:hypothetical protein Tco_1558024, partial [Tanacetum coccineum]